MFEIIKNINNKTENFFSRVDIFASLIFRVVLGTAFIIHGLNKFPLPPEGLMEYFDLSPALASFVALSELFVGFTLIASYFIKSHYGNIFTRLSGFIIIVIMTNIFAIAHQDWFITKKLCTSEQIILLIGGIYFLIKGNKK